MSKVIYIAHMLPVSAYLNVVSLVPEANPADPTLTAPDQTPPVLSSPSTESLASRVVQDAVSVLEAVDLETVDGDE